MKPIMLLKPDEAPLWTWINGIKDKYRKRHYRKRAKKKKIGARWTEDKLTPNYEGMKPVDDKKPQWLDDNLQPVDFGPYRIIGHSRDPDGTHYLWVRDMVNNIDIKLVGHEE
ncbi:MAG: hypothetical protein GTN80_11620 [Nitrososphaeria archaeon]|nr:hypothetical protein [Nitrososphaeria archaeon]NIQ34265.1 hypothetical protein [Nitrososphaeria archaeon]